MQTPPRQIRDDDSRRAEESRSHQHVENNDNNNNQRDDDSSDDESSNADTVVVLEGPPQIISSNVVVNANNSVMTTGMWNPDTPLWALSPMNSERQMEERLGIIRGKLRDLQNQSCRQFFLLCLVPAVLMSVVIWALLADFGPCGDDHLTTCSRERRTFINAYTSRCICNAVRLKTS